MQKLYLFIIDLGEWEDIVIFDCETEAKKYLEKQRELYHGNTNFRIEIFEKNTLNKFLPTYKTLSE